MTTTYGPETARAMLQSGWRPMIFLILPIFFALSGFLVAGSLSRVATLKEFFALRALRIVPALFVEVTLSALILGPWVTTLPLDRYFTDGEFWRYFLNIAGWIHYDLPGVFETNPHPSMVNGSLWTIPFELECYVALAAIGLVGLHKRRLLLSALVIGGTLALCIWAAVQGAAFTNTPPGRLLVLSFLAGVLAFQWRDRLTMNGWLALSSLALCVLCLLHPATVILTALPAAYLTAFAGLALSRRVTLFGAADWSYGLYLYAWPFQQLYAHLFPSALHYWLSVPATLLSALVFAAVSWRLIEKPALSRKAALVRFVNGHGISAAPHVTMTKAS